MSVDTYVPETDRCRYTEEGALTRVGPKTATGPVDTTTLREPQLHNQKTRVLQCIIEPQILGIIDPYLTGWSYMKGSTIHGKTPFSGGLVGWEFLRTIG